ncbi:MAG: hypothetical protein QOF44_897, partial [Streptomyces sp.]|nr:hypothetical protein [Streptomyces sp.]
MVADAGPALLALPEGAGVSAAGGGDGEPEAEAEGAPEAEGAAEGEAVSDGAALLDSDGPATSGVEGSEAAAEVVRRGVCPAAGVPADEAEAVAEADAPAEGLSPGAGVPLTPGTAPGT